MKNYDCNKMHSRLVVVKKIEFMNVVSLVVQVLCLDCFWSSTRNSLRI